MKNVAILSLFTFVGVLGLCPDAAAQPSAPEWMLEDSLVVDHFTSLPAWNVSAAISGVKGSKLEKTFVQNTIAALAGEIPGLTLGTASGEPGADTPAMNARGYNTLSSTDRSVLVIVDGFEGSFDYLTAQDIETVTLLKDAAATAIYGMKAANGVLLVTTKRGAEKPMEINFSAQAGITFPSRRDKFLDSYAYASLYNEACANDGLEPYYDSKYLNAYKNGGNPYLYPNVDWADALLTDVSYQQNYNFNIRGGDKNVRYYSSVNVSDNNGFFRGTDPKRNNSSNAKFTKYNIRSNIDINILENLTAHFNFAADIGSGYSPAGGSASYYNKIANVPANAFPMYNPNGTYGGNDTFSNPLGDLIGTGLNSYNSRTVQTALTVKYAFRGALKGLELSLGFSFNNYFRGNSDRSCKYEYFSVSAAEGGGYKYNSFSEKTSMVVNEKTASQWRKEAYVANVNYHRTFSGKHTVGADLQFFNDVNNKLADSGLKDNMQPYRFIGVRGRLSYAYGRRYLVDFSFAEQGTNLYAPGKRFGFFPAASAGWVASNEEFLRDSDALTFLKVRASYGLVGNSSIAGSKRFAWTQDYKSSSGYYIGTTATEGWVGGLMEDSVADVDRTWEKEKRFNVGVDAELWKGLDFSVDYFIHKRSDILVSPAGNIPGVLGMTFEYKNLGRATNHGFEASVGYHGTAGSDFTYYAKANVWYARNRIDYQAEEVKPYENLVTTGFPIGQPFGLKAIGLFRDQEEIDKAPEQTFSVVKPGDIRYEDVNKDGYIDSQDATAIGKTGNPEFTGSLTLGLKWKGLVFEAMFYGVAGRSVYLSGNSYWAFMNEYSAPASALLRWTEATKDTAEYPRLSTMANPNNTQYSSFWLKDGSFLKLKYLEIGYTVPFRLAGKDNSLRVFLNGTNLFTLHKLHKYTNADPEGMGGFPQIRTVSLGLKFKFSSVNTK